MVTDFQTSALEGAPVGGYVHGGRAFPRSNPSCVTY